MESPDDLDYARLTLLGRKVAAQPDWSKLRIALLGDCALQHMIPLFAALFARRRVAVEIYEGGFDTIDAEVYASGSQLYAFDPDVIVLLDSAQQVRDAWFTSATPRESFASGVLDKLSARWEAIAGRSRAIIIQSNFAMPLERVFGNYENKLAHSLTTTIATINRGLAELSRDRKSVFINDVEHISSYVGRAAWFEDRLWTVGKLLCAPAHLPRVAKNVIDVALAARGAVVKCVVLDLDNTLWGGIIGDDGLEGIRLGHLEDGEAFVAMQRFALELSRRGIVLAVCSKNEHATAILPFRDHPDMVLREGDITMFLANWNDKAQNITLIKETLNIGYDSIVFVDDNPFERNLVRELLPDVIVPELPEDPSEYVRALSALNLFETTSFSDLDRDRAALYRTAAQRVESKRAFATVEEYLESLDMVIDIRRFEDFDLPRIAQLIQRSNQFNLATRRFSEAECAAFARDTDRYVPLSVRLRDKFGDYGLIAVLVMRLEGTVGFIDEYVMSCRVLQRGVEQYLMTHLFETARSRGITRIEGTYVPTRKNGMVRAFYEQFGFVPSAADEKGVTRWSLEVAAFRPERTYIKATSEPSRDRVA